MLALPCEDSVADIQSARQQLRVESTRGFGAANARSRMPVGAVHRHTQQWTLRSSSVPDRLRFTADSRRSRLGVRVPNGIEYMITKDLPGERARHVAPIQDRYRHTRIARTLMVVLDYDSRSMAVSTPSWASSAERCHSASPPKVFVPMPMRLTFVPELPSVVYSISRPRVVTRKSFGYGIC